MDKICLSGDHPYNWNRTFEAKWNLDKSEQAFGEGRIPKILDVRSAGTEDGTRIKVTVDTLAGQISSL